MSSEAVSGRLPSGAGSRRRAWDAAIAGRPWLVTLAPLGLYLVLSLAFFGRHVVLHLGSRLIASDPIDSSQFTWFLGWWPHAILHGLNPFVTHAMFVPGGFNLTWSTAMPGPAILLAPVTLLFGPVVTYNVIEIAAPALTAWATFLLCRHITRRVAPSLIGGYLFGFSPFVLKHLTGGPYLALAALLPVFVMLVLRRLDGTLSERRFVVAMTVAMVAQYSISSETLATSGVFGGVALVLAFILLPARRAAIVGIVQLLIVALVATAVVISPSLYFFFFGHQYPPGATFFPADLTTYAIPPPIVELARHQPPLVGSNDESYLGVPLLLAILAFAWERRTQSTTWIVFGTAVIAGICSLGSGLIVHGQLTSISLPWKLIGKLPVLRYALPLRLVEFVILPAAIMVAMWLGSRPGDGRGGGRAKLARYGLALTAIVFILPAVGSSNWNTSAQDPPFFARGTYRAYLKPTDNVLTFPAFGPNERWQANTGYAFRLSDGYAGNPIPPSYTRFSIWSTLTGGALVPHYSAELRRFMAAKRVTAIVVDSSIPGPWTVLFKALGARPRSIGGVLYYRVAPPGSRGG